MTRTNKNKISPIVQKPTVVSVNNQRSTLGQSIKDGFGLGVGVSLAQHAVNGVMGFLTAPPAKPSISTDNKRALEYEQCMKYSANDYESCKVLLSS